MLRLNALRKGDGIRRVNLSAFFGGFRQRRIRIRISSTGVIRGTIVGVRANFGYHVFQSDFFNALLGSQLTVGRVRIIPKCGMIHRLLLDFG